MSMREVPAPERDGGDSGLTAVVAERVSDGLSAHDPSPVPASVWPSTPAPSPAVPPAPAASPTSSVERTASAVDRPASTVERPASTVERPGFPPRPSGPRQARSHAVSGRATAPGSPLRPSMRPARPAGRSRRTVLYDDQTRPGPDGPPVEVRKVRRVLRRIDTWSLFRFAVMLYACAMLVFLVAAIGLWIVASTAGAIPSIEHFITSLFALKRFHFRAGQLFLGLVGMGIVWVLAATLFTTVAGVLYNLISDVVGGIEVTVLEEEPLDIVG